MEREISDLSVSDRAFLQSWNASDPIWQHINTSFEIPLEDHEIRKVDAPNRKYRALVHTLARKLGYESVKDRGNIELFCTTHGCIMPIECSRPGCDHSNWCVKWCEDFREETCIHQDMCAFEFNENICPMGRGCPQGLLPCRVCPLGTEHIYHEEGEYQIDIRPHCSVKHVWIANDVDDLPYTQSRRSVGKHLHSKRQHTKQVQIEQRIAFACSYRYGNDTTLHWLPKDLIPIIGKNI